MANTSTNIVPAGAAAAEVQARFGHGLIGFTLCFHPELERIGQICTIDLGRGAVTVDRESPRFGPPGLPETGSGLATSFVSNKFPLCLTPTPNGGFLLHPAADSRQATVHLPERNSSPCVTPVEIHQDELEGRGVIVLLNRSIVLLLHRLPLDARRPDGSALSSAAKGLVAQAKALVSEITEDRAAQIVARMTALLRGPHGADAAVLAHVASLARELALLSADKGASIKLAHEAAEVLRKAAILDRLQNGVVGESRAIQELWAEIVSLDRFGPVMLLGEQGTGKTEAAAAIARFSVRKQPMTYKNAASLVPSVAAAELFGRKKGFLGSDDPGLAGIFRNANEGTLFLDEIGDLPEDVQPKLLDAVERGFITPVGDQEVPIDVRLITATNKDLTSTGFKRDLHDRLSGFQIRIPSLRERREDIPRLLMHFLKEAWGARMPRAPEPKERRAEWAAGWAGFMVRLLSDQWPGNVRVLRTVARRLASANPISIDAQGAFAEPAWPEAVPFGAPVGDGTESSKTSWTQFIAMSSSEQREYLEALLAKHGSQLKAAAELGVSGPTMNRKCKELRLMVSDLSDSELKNPPKWANAKAVSEERSERARLRSRPPH